MPPKGGIPQRALACQTSRNYLNSQTASSYWSEDLQKIFLIYFYSSDAFVCWSRVKQPGNVKAETKRGIDGVRHSNMAVAYPQPI